MNKKDYNDTNLLELALFKLGLTKEQLIEEYRIIEELNKIPCTSFLYLDFQRKD